MRRSRSRPRSVREPPPDFDVVAAVVQRLAVLLGAGIAPASAWRYAASGLDSAVAAVIADSGAVGRDLVGVLLAARATAPPAEQAAWSALAAAWSVAIDVGAPLGPTLQRFAGTLRELAESLREVEVALAGPRATSRVVLALPAIGLVFGVVLGFDAPRILLTTPPGWICLALGVLLIVGGVRWNRSLLRRARALDATPGLALELLAIAVSGGASLDRSRQTVADALAGAGLPEPGPDADAVLAIASGAGVPVAALLHAEAEELRRRARSDARRRSAELATQLLLPLGVCILPAFIALGVAPVAISILSTTVGTLQ